MCLRFGGIVIDPASQRVSIRGKAVHVTPRVFATLLTLVERSDALVTREQLMREVWRDTAVESNSVSQAVASVRRLLAGAGERGRLRTVPGRGYTFAGPVEKRDAGAEHSSNPGIVKSRVSLLITAAAAGLVLAVTPGHRTPIETVSVVPLAAAQELDGSLREGRELLGTRTGRDMRRAAAMFTATVSRSPSSAPAWTALAEAHYLLGFYGLAEPGAAAAAAEAAATRAITLNQASARAYVIRASVVLDTRWDLAASASDFTRALALNPDDPLAQHWWAWWCLAAGRMSQAREAIERAVHLQPLSAPALTARGTFAYLDGRMDDAIAASRQVLQLDPGFFRAHLRLGLAQLASGRAHEALTSLEQAFDLAPDVPEAVAALAHARAVAGDRDGAERLYEQHRRVLSLYDQAVVLTGLDRRGEALAVLLRARRLGQLTPGLFAAEPRLAPLRGLTDYARLVPPVSAGPHPRLLSPPMTDPARFFF